MAKKKSTKAALIPAVGYLRRSTDKQEKSIVDQRQAILQYAEEHGYRIIGWYIDDGISGDATEKRLDFKRMRDDAGRGEFSRALLDRGLQDSGIPTNAIAGYQREEWGHLAVAAAVASGGADAGVGVKAAALAMDLEFIPLEDETYDLAIPEHFINEVPVQTLLDILRQETVHRRVESLGGYDASQMGLPAAA